MKIAILDDYQDCVRSLEAFRKLDGHQVAVFHDTPRDRAVLAERLADAEAVVLIRERTTIDDQLLERLPRLKLIAQTGKLAGHVDVEACRRRGIVVTEGQGSGAAVAELTLLLVLASLRHLVAEANRLRRGEWQGSLGRQLAGRSVGLVGYGRVGSRVAALLAACGARLRVWGRPSTLARAEAAGIATSASLGELLATSDIVSLHLRLTAETRHVIRPEHLAAMRPDALFVNTSRAEIVAPGALEAALRAGRPGSAAVDVFEEEPVLGASHPLLSLPNCLATPHIGFVERDNYEAYFGSAFDSINSFARGCS